MLQESDEINIRRASFLKFVNLFTGDKGMGE